MLDSWKHCVARGWTEAAAANAEAKKKKKTQKTEISFMENASEYIPINKTKPNITTGPKWK